MKQRKQVLTAASQAGPAPRGEPLEVLSTSDLSEEAVDAHETLVPKRAVCTEFGRGGGRCDRVDSRAGFLQLGDHEIRGWKACTDALHGKSLILRNARRNHRIRMRFVAEDVHAKRCIVVDQNGQERARVQAARKG